MSNKNKVVIITGASSGIGASIAEKLSENGFDLVLAARREEKLNELNKKLSHYENKIKIVKTDVTDAKQVEYLVNTANNEFGKVDALINNAGIMPLSYLEEGRLQDWENMIDVNIKGVLYGINSVLPIMKEQKRGHIINISSVAGRQVFPTAAVYCATKFAVNAITEGMRQELSSKYNIKVTAIEPGATQTELQDHIPNDDIKNKFAERTKTTKILEARDIANAVYYALSQPGHVNVTEIMVHPTEGPR